MKQPRALISDALHSFLLPNFHFKDLSNVLEFQVLESLQWKEENFWIETKKNLQKFSKVQEFVKSRYSKILKKFTMHSRY